ncbi:hypothetical protein [Sphingomonas sp. CV7422]|uniref:hypothetical protein n=1 Tax=Sphingomonas sp. CV7422 TaxID=3018036 RepID=UPI0022FE1888|nr:hypothetical protein [Sphingomonas sp. CV7422]
MDVDFASLIHAVSVTTVVAGVIVVGSSMILPRVARLGVDWIKGTVDDSAGDRWDRYASKNGIWYDDDGYARTKDGGFY